MGAQRVKDKQRDSNIELLRIIAMLMVLIVHASFKALNPPTFADLQTLPVNTFFRFLSESVSIIAVNVFVLISGWFGIKFRLLRLSEFLFQIFFFGLLIYGIMLLTSNAIHTDIIKDLFNIFMMQDYWFAKAYLVLYIFSPLLNTFVEKTDKKQFSFFLIAFYCIQTLHGFITESTWFFYGNSPLSFMGLYLLARYMRLYPSKITRMSKRFDLLAYVGLTLLTTVLSMITVYCKHGGWSFYAYSSPIVILAAVYFFLFFTKISFKSKFINWVALSSFSVYLLNDSSFISQPFYIKTIVSWYISDTSVVFLFHTASLIAIFFVSAIIIDKLRLALWNFCLVLLSKL